MVDAKNMSNTSAVLSLKGIILHTACADHREIDSPSAPTNELGEEICVESAKDGRKDNYTTRDSYLATRRQMKTTLNTYLLQCRARASERIIQKSFATPPIITTHNRSLFIQ